VQSLLLAAEARTFLDDLLQVTDRMDKQAELPSLDLMLTAMTPKMSFEKIDSERRDLFYLLL
jgi:hypothetical protein